MCKYLTAMNWGQRMVSKVCQEWCVSQQNNHHALGLDTTLRRIPNPQHDILWIYRISRGRSLSSSRPLRRCPRKRSTHRRPWGATRYARRPSTTTDRDTRARSGQDLLNDIIALSIEEPLQVLGYYAVNTSTRVLHSIVLVIGVERTVLSICHCFAFRKARGLAMISAATTSVRHLQRKKQQAIQKLEKQVKIIL